MDMSRATCIFYPFIPFFQKAYLMLVSQQCGLRVRILASTSYVGEFVVGSLPCSERFSDSGFFGFPLSFKINTFKFRFDLERTDTF